MSFQHNRLEAKVKAVNTANAEAIRLQSILKAAIAPFVGQKVIVGEGNLSAKLDKVLQPLLPGSFKGPQVWRYRSNYTLTYVVKTCESIKDGSCLYHETYFDIGELDGAILKSVLERKLECRTDYTVKEIQDKRAAADAAEKKSSEAKSALKEFQDRF